MLGQILARVVVVDVDALLVLVAAMSSSAGTSKSHSKPEPTLAVEHGAKMSSAEKQRLQRYQRGKGNTARGIKQHGLKLSVKRGEAKFAAAAKRAAQAELLLPSEAGLLEAEGPMERTDRVSQRQVAAAVDEQTARKAYNMSLDRLGPYRLNYTADGRTLLLAGRKGHLAVVDWARARDAGAAGARDGARRDVPPRRVDVRGGAAQEPVHLRRRGRRAPLPPRPPAAGQPPRLPALPLAARHRRPVWPPALPRRVDRRQRRRPEHAARRVRLHARQLVERRRPPRPRQGRRHHVDAQHVGAPREDALPQGRRRRDRRRPRRPLHGDVGARRPRSSCGTCAPTARCTSTRRRASPPRHRHLRPRPPRRRRRPVGPGVQRLPVGARKRRRT